ncbi:hypothetical protein IGI04_019469, partial [Brassica rapa subsp. trilocularis]
TFCWSYTRNCQYTVKSGYWVAQNLLKTEEEKEVLEPSITKLQAFAWTLKAPKKICHLIWKLLTGHMDLGHPLPNSLDVDGSEWTVVGIFNSWGHGIFLRESALHMEVEALRWAIENMLQHSSCQNFGTDCKELIAMIKEPHA